MSNQFTLGVTPSTPDTRDYHITKLVPKLNVFPTNFMCDLTGVNPHNQQDVGACVAFSLTLIKEMQERKERGTYSHFSPLYIYANRAATDNQEAGMYPREALARLKEYGVCKESELPDLVEVPQAYDVFKAKITPAITEAAKKNKIAAYARLSARDDIKSALMQIGPVTFCAPVYSNFYYPVNGVIQSPSGNLDGYHEMTIVGWDDNKGWRVLNSWGASWADGGYCWYPYGLEVVEAWSVTDYIEPNVNPGNKFHKVINGAYKFKFLADYALIRMKKKGVQGYVIRKGNDFYIQLGAFTTEAEAKARIEELAKQGFKTSYVYE